MALLFYCRLLPNQMDTLEALFKPKVTSLPGHIQSVYVQNVTKLYSTILVKAEADGDNDKIREVGQLMLDKLPMFVQSSDLEVQERVSGHMTPTCPNTVLLIFS